jgi:hypothetical protein
MWGRETEPQGLALSLASSARIEPNLRPSSRRRPHSYRPGMQPFRTIFQRVPYPALLFEFVVQHVIGGLESE